MAEKEKKVIKAKIKPKKKNKGGRPKGSAGKERQSLLQYAIDAGQTPAQYLIDIYTGKKDSTKEGEHVYTYVEKTEAAKAVAPYCHAKLRTTEIKSDLIPAVLMIVDA